MCVLLQYILVIVTGFNLCANINPGRWPICLALKSTLILLNGGIYVCLGGGAELQLFSWRDNGIKYVRGVFRSIWSMKDGYHIFHKTFPHTDFIR